MKRLLLFAVVVAVTVLITILCWLRTPSLTLSSEEMRLSEVSGQSSSTKQQSPPHGGWMWDGGGRTGRKGALNVSFSRYKANDGIVVEQVVERYNSAAKARQRLDEVVAHAMRVVERTVQGPSQNRKDRVYLVATLRGEQVTIIAWTDDSLLYMLRSPSAPHVIEFEQQVYGPNRR